MGDEALAHFEASGLSWTTEAGAAARVRERVAEALLTLHTHEDVTVIKSNLVRTVLRVPLPGGGPGLIVKRYHVRGFTDWVKYLFKPSRAKAEWWAGRALAAAGVPTAVPMAMAERRRVVLRDAALVVPEIEDALHLNAYVEAHLQGSDEADRRRGALYDELARIIRRMHDATLLHNDFHGGNVLVSGPPDAPSLHVIDLHSVSRGTSFERRCFDVEKLLHSMLTCSSREERKRFWTLYASDDSALAQRFANLERTLVQMEEKRVRSRTVRALTRSSRFDIARRGGYRVHHLRELPASAFPPLVAAHDRTLAAGGRDVLKDAPRSALTRQTLARSPGGDTAGARSVVVKEYRFPGLADRAKNLLRRPRPVSAWVNANGLRVRRFEPAEALALLLGGRGRWLNRAFLVMEDVGERTRLDLVALERFAGALDAAGRAEKRALVVAVARVLRRLHEHGVYHADLKAVNLFVRESPDAPADVVFADYDRVEFGTAVSDRRRIKNLAQLSASVAVCISLTDRLRFFREYARDEPEIAARWKHWFGGVIAACERKIVVRMEPIE